MCFLPKMRYHVLFLAAVLLAVAGARAQGPGRTPLPSQQALGDRGQAGLEGSSPFDAPAGTDTVFVVDEAPGLDTGCTFRSGGPLVFDIDVTRYVGDVNALVAAGAMAPTARLRMPAFDVDFDAVVSNGFPERDEVWFNGHLVPEVYLTGADGVWKLNSFTVPVDWINFATLNPGAPPTPGVNTIEIHIDVANAAAGKELWCTAIDWAALEIEVARPVVLVDGVAEPNDIWNTVWVPNLQQIGLPFDAGLDLPKLDTILANGAAVRARIEMMRREWGVEKVVVVAHSKGGVDARLPLPEGAVSQLIQIGAPNLGSRLADFIQAKSVRLRGIAPNAVINAMGTRAGLEMTTWAMGMLNGALPAPPGVKLTSVAGDYDLACPPGSLCRPLAQALFAITGAGDGAVHLASAHGLPGTEPRTWSSAGTDKSATHMQQPSSGGIFSLVEDLLLTDASTSGPLPGAQPSTWQAGQSHADVMTQGGSTTFTLEVGSADPALFVLLYPSADVQPDNDLDLVLQSPTGTIWDAAAAAGAAGVGWEEDAIPGGWAEVFQFDSSTAEAGTWTVTVNGTAVVDPSGEIGFSAGVLVDAPAFTLEVSAAPTAVRTGESVVVTATVLSAGSPAVGATVDATVEAPDGSQTVVGLLDDGVPPDLAAGDGLYTGQFTADQAGEYAILVEAQEAVVDAGGAVREAFLLATATGAGADFTGVFGDAGEDTNGNGFFDWLVLDVGLDIATAGNPGRIGAVAAGSNGVTRYRLVGELTDSASNVIAARSEADLGPTATGMALRFDGRQLFRNGVDGPFTVSRLSLYELDGNNTRLVVELVDPHTTQGYTFDEFEHTAISLTGVGSDEAIDDDGNGKFDRLEIRVEVRVESAGLYEWTARLVDQNGTEIAFVSGSGNFNPGVNDMSFTVPGTAIGANGVDGPYILRDLLIFSGATSLVAGEIWRTAAYAVSGFEGYTPPPPPPGGGGGTTFSFSNCQVRADARPDPLAVLALLGGLLGLGWLARRSRP